MSVALTVCHICVAALVGLSDLYVVMSVLICLIFLTPCAYFSAYCPVDTL